MEPLYDFLLHEFLRELTIILSIPLEPLRGKRKVDIPLHKCLEPAMEKIYMPHMMSRACLAWDTAYERARRDAHILYQRARKEAGKALRRREADRSTRPRHGLLAVRDYRLEKRGESMVTKFSLA
jgi:hypothetical protein